MAPGAKTCGVFRSMNCADLPGAERIAVDVERRRAGAILERLLVAFEAAARVRAGHAVGRVT